MSSRTKLFGGLIGAFVLLAILGGGAWYFVLRDDAPEKATLAGALDSLNTPAATNPTSTTLGSAPATAAATTASGGAATASGLTGTWVPDATQQIFLGYRVVEELARIGTTTAVGRTSGITGSVVVNGNTLTSAKITADMTALKSDSNMRDGQLRNQAIEYAKFPTSTFEVTEPMTLPDALAAGQSVETTLKGKLTLHGVTRDVSIPVQAQLKDGLLVVVGNIDIKFADYAINKPQGASVLSIEDHGLMELQLVRKKG